MNIEQLTAEFASSPIGRRIRHDKEVTSTNSLALEEFRLGRTQHGDIFVADRQSAGRGQSGRSWQSGADDGLWMSLVLMDKSPPQPLPFLPCLAIHDYLHDELGIAAHLKWPNDILVGRRKIAGILVETTTSGGNQQGWVIGCGINLKRREFSDELAGRATSICLECRESPSREDVLRGVVRRLNHWLASSRDLVAAWTERSRMPGSTLTVERRGERHEVTVAGLSPEGYLLLRHEDGRIETIISSSDIELPLEF